MSSRTQSERAGVARPAYGLARLVVHRVPGLGINVIVNLWIDGVMIEPLTYGRSYEGALPSGRHVLSLLPSPNARWRVPSHMILDVRRGQIYSFTATGDGSGHLILLRNRVAI
jgi:hypothetical protein